MCVFQHIRQREYFFKSSAKYLATSYVEDSIRLTMGFRGASALGSLERLFRWGGLDSFWIGTFWISFGIMEDFTSEIISQSQELDLEPRKLKERLWVECWFCNESYFVSKTTVALPLSAVRVTISVFPLRLWKANFSWVSLPIPNDFLRQLT